MSYTETMKKDQTNKTAVIRIIEGLKNDLEQILDYSDTDSDDSKLIAKQSHGNTYFYRNIKGKAVYLTLSDKAEISKYAQKRYRTGVRKAAEKEIAQLNVSFAKNCTRNSLLA